MTHDTERTRRATLTEEVARAVAGVEGVAFLKPGVAQLLRSALPSTPRTAAGTRHAGVRMSRGSVTSPPRLDIQIVARRDARALEVARAARRAADTCLATLLPGEEDAVRVVVTITGQA
ncbi:hypothetical protein [Streptomyces sp. ITFR-6]|uniref:hypothetical protein n=1 Tax=Streptomyces sp. ITFR-6 TaxID=3075197 RepID=UPI002889FF5D|nr:hypothetical protein [Streptomyces sp. ITFR-6]WNI31192.1 hypothetical protein RLT59_22180 [Streptomyces sp. ITFR-6]